MKFLIMQKKIKNVFIIKYGDHRDLHSFPTRRSSDLDEYINNINENKSVIEEELENTEKDNIEEFMFMGLRMIKGIEEKEFEIRFKKKVDEVYKEVIEKHIKNSLLIRENGRIFLTKKGIELSNIVMSDMILE